MQEDLGCSNLDFGTWEVFEYLNQDSTLQSDPDVAAAAANFFKT